MKVMYFIEEGKLGGPQVQMVRVAAALSGRADVEIIVPTQNSEAFRRLCGEFGVRHRKLPISRLTKEFFPLLTFLLRSPIEVARMVHLVRTTRPDLIHAWGGSWQVKAALISRLTGVPLVWLMNDTKVPGGVMKVFRLFAPLCGGFIFASHRSEDYYLPNIPERARTTVIQSMVDTDEFNPENDYPGEEKFIAELGDLPVIGMVANINPVKGLETFIRVAAQAKANGIDTRFIVVGPVFRRQKAYFESLKLLIRQLDATNVMFVGARSDVRALLGRFDVYLCTSAFESSPVAVWEAMAMGCPIVSTDVGDVPRFVRDFETGFVAPASDEHALWPAVQRLITDRSLARHMGNAARRVAEAEFGRQTIVDQTMSFYEAVAREHRQRFGAVSGPVDNGQ